MTLDAIKDRLIRSTHLKWIQTILVCSCTINLIGSAQLGLRTPSNDADAPELVVANGDSAISRIALSASTARLFSIESNHRSNAGTGSEDAFMDVYDTRTLQRISRVPVCPAPTDIAVNDYTRRVVVVCDRYSIVAKHTISDTTVVVLDVSSLRVIASTDLTGAAQLAMGGSHSPYAYVLSDGHVEQIETCSGSVLGQRGGPNDSGVQYSALSVSGESTDRVTLFSDRSATTFQADKPARPVVKDFGRRRFPAARIDADGAEIFALSGAGTLIRFDASGSVERIPICDSPVKLMPSAATQRLVTLCAPLTSADRVELVASDFNGGERRSVTLAGMFAQPRQLFGAPPTVQDQASQRIAVLGSKSVYVVDAAGPRQLYEVPCAGSPSGVILDAASGDVFVSFFGNSSSGGIMRFNIRAEKPIAKNSAYTSQPPAWVESSTIFLGFDDAFDLPARLDPPGIRSPVDLAPQPDGAFIVRELLSPAVGYLTSDGYTNVVVPLKHAAVRMVSGRDGKLWFLEAHDGPDSLVARRDADGRVAEFEMGSSALPSDVVASSDGLYWLHFEVRDASLPHLSLGHLSYEGRSSAERSVPTIEGPAGLGWPAAIAGDPHGGAWILFSAAFSSGLVHVDAAGKWTRYPTLRSMWDDPTPSLFELDGGRVAVAYRTRILVVSPDRATRIYFPALGLPSPGLKDQGPYIHASARPPECRFTSVTSGPADSIWGVCNNAIVEIDADGTVRRHRLPFEQSAPASLVRGSDGSIWFVETTQSKIGRIAPDGTLHEIGI